jgi:undecaprenyl-diphosphatase
MDLSNLNFLFDWVQAHPALAGLAIFLLSFGEALALVGLFMPGAAIMLAIGALIGTGDLEFWPTFGWSVAGAIAGDGVSFWLGRRFHERLHSLWPFSRYPHLIPRAADFLDRHGGKSILFARFIGPLRPVLPAVAGMLDMPARRFLAANILSALVWAPAYLVPGAILGASLDLAAEVTTRLAVVILVLLAIVVMVVWGVRALFNVLHPRAHALLRRGLAWAKIHPVAGRIPASLLDPRHREAKGLTLMALILIAAAAAFLWLLDAVEAGGTITSVDDYVFHYLQGIRTPWMDRFMAAMTGLGDWQVLLPLFGAILLWLGWQKRWQAAAYWTAAAAFALVLTEVLKISVGILRPQAVYDGLSAFSFPSGHAVLAMVVYGFLAVLFARELHERYRASAYAAAAVLILTVSFSRLYLGAHWLSDVLAGLSLGLIWVSLLGIAYRSHPAATLPLRGLVIASGLAFGIAALVHFPESLQQAQTRYAPVQTDVRMEGAGWWREEWATLPAFRADLRTSRRQPLNVQYAGELETLTAVLAKQGWRPPAELNGASWLQWFTFKHEIMKLPVLPQVHEGEHEALLLVRPVAGQRDRLWALRVWHSGVVLSPGETPVWVGNVTQLGLYRPVPGFAAPRANGEFDRARIRLDRDLGTLQRRTVARPQEMFARNVLLVRADSGTRKSANERK